MSETDPADLADQLRPRRLRRGRRGRGPGPPHRRRRGLRGRRRRAAPRGPGPRRGRRRGDPLMSDLHEPTTDLRGRLARAPKVVLHDHLDGGLRASTLLELADEIGHELPESTPEALAAWVQRQADSGSLVSFPGAVLPHRRGAADAPRAGAGGARERARHGRRRRRRHGEPVRAGAVHRGGPEHRGGARRGAGRSARRRRGGRRRRPPDPRRRDRLRDAPGRQVAGGGRAALSRRDAGVVGFDIAGPEIGFPATDHAEAFALLRSELMPFTVHAGEAVGPESVAQALAVGASRLGHGVRGARGRHRGR
ncbi:MAG: hypothetical protein PGN11_17570 [Quadrisphaera sp.]